MSILRDLLDGLKFITSKNARDSWRAAIQLFRKNEPWSSNFFVQKTVISRKNRELSSAFYEAIKDKMVERGFSEETISNFGIVYSELILNGFSHGCLTDNESITLRVVVFGSGVSLEVTNNNKRKTIQMTVDEIRKRAVGLRGNQVEGRGLPLAYKISDQFDIIDNGRTVKVAFHDDATSVDYTDGDITTINVGDYLSDYRWKIADALESNRGLVILLFSNKPDKPISASVRSIDVVQSHDRVTAFAVVIDRAHQQILGDLKAHFPKFIGFFTSVEKAAIALAPLTKRKQTQRSSGKSTK